MRYRRVGQRFWKDEAVRDFDTTDKLIALYGFTGQANRIGLFTFSPGMAAEDTGTLPPTFAERFRKVCKILKWKWDERVGVLYLPTWWRYNQPENPNVLISMLSDLEGVPESPLATEFRSNLSYLDERLHQAFRDTLTKRYPQRSPRRMGDREQEQEITTLSSANGARPRIPSPNGDRAEAEAILAYLNQSARKTFRPGDVNVKLITARLSAGATPELCRRVIDRKVRAWRGDLKMAEYLRPKTLFNAMNFEQYVGELPSAAGDEDDDDAP